MTTTASPSHTLLIDPAATESLGATLASSLRPGDLLLLEGPLGAGKTTLVRGLVAALGGDASEVCSPTFVLLETYDVAAGEIVRVHHADLYRLRGRGEAPWEEVGLGDVLDDQAAITAVEWPQEWSFVAGAGGRVWHIRLAYHDEGREAEITVEGG
jgi:tRNA threonylcarbamoyladenosine biosynthesis protein TsaE